MTKKFKCPKCKKELDYVNVISTCWQIADLKENRIIEFGDIEVGDTIFIECPECQAKITKHIDY